MSRKMRANARYEKLIAKIGPKGEDAVAEVLGDAMKDMGSLVSKLGLSGSEDVAFFVSMTLLSAGVAGTGIGIPFDEIVEAATITHQHLADMTRLMQAEITPPRRRSQQPRRRSRRTR